jgi:hypothetical protein
MPLTILRFKPGVDTETTPVLSEAGWNNSQLIRWRAGLPEKLGGWVHLNQVALVGTGRGIHVWADLAGIAYVAVGTEQRLQLFTGGLMYDITPLRATSNISPDFSTVSTSKTVTVHDTAHGASPGDWTDEFVVVSVGGILLLGFYQVQTVVDANNYTITAPTAATATVNNGGAVPSFTTTNASPNVTVLLANHGLSAGGLFQVQVSTTVGGITLLGTYPVISSADSSHFVIAPGPAATADSVSENSGHARIEYLIQSGLASATPLSGYGIGAYGSGLYGEGGDPSVNDIAPLRQWFLDNWGQDLIGNYNGSTMYVWAPPEVPGNVAVPTGGTTPTEINSSFVAMPAQIAVALGAETSGTFDPNLIRWSDVDDFTDWVATAVNQAGSYRLPTGSKIIGGIQGPQFACIWTDIDMWLMEYIQPPFIFGFNKIGATSTVSARAAGIYASSVYWLSQNNFCVYDGNSIQVLDCTVWDQFFYDVNLAQADKIFCAVNLAFNEIGWFYPSLNSNEVDSYVKYNVVEKAWDYGTLIRTCWAGRSVLGPPIGTDTAGLLQQHEIGHDADGQAMLPSVQSGYLSLSDGEIFTFVERLIGDFILTGGVAPNNRVMISLTFQDYPNGPTRTYGPFQWSGTMPNYSIVRGRSRTVSVTISSLDLGVFWRMGGLRLLNKPAGKR